MANTIKFRQITNEPCNVISVKSDTDTLDKGYLCSISALEDDETSLYDVTEPTGVEGATPTEADLVIIAGDEGYINSFGQKTGGITDPRNITYPAGTILKAERFPRGRKFKINQSAIDVSGGVAIAVGKYLVPKDASYQMATSATIPAGVGCVFIIEKIDEPFAVGGSYVDALVARRVV